MTLNELLASRSVIDDQAADVAFELWQGERPVEVHDNQGDDWQEKPVVLSIDGQTIRLTANQADAIRAKIDFALQEYGNKLSEARMQETIATMGDNPLEVV